MITYKIITNLNGADVLQKTTPDGKVWWVPIDPNNSDYQAYLADPTGLLEPIMIAPTVPTV